VILLVGLGFISDVFGHKVSGTVQDVHGSAIPYARVDISGKSTFSVLSDSSGNFTFKNIEPGNYLFMLKAIGYYDYLDSVYIDKDRNIGTITLKEDVLGLGEVVVSGTMKETYLRKSPVKIEVISSAHLM